MEQMLKSGDSLWMVPSHLAQQAKEAQKKAQDRKDPDKEKRLVGDFVSLTDGRCFQD